MSWNVKSALVNKNLYAKHKTPYRTIPPHPELCGGRGTRTHKSLRTTVFKAEYVAPIRLRDCISPPDSCGHGRTTTCSIPISPDRSRKENVTRMSIMGLALGL